MLILSRKVGEEIVIGEDVVVSVARVARSRAYLGITAPRNVRVDRREVRLARKRGLDAANYDRLASAAAGPAEKRPDGYAPGAAGRLSAD